MTTKLLAFEMSTGLKLTPLPVSGGGWAVTTGAADTVDAEVRIDTADARKLATIPQSDLRRVGLVAVVDGVPVAAGPILKRSFQGNTMKLAAGGLLDYLDGRVLLPLAARTTPLVDANGDPVTSLDTSIVNASLGSIGRHYVETIAAFPGTPPIVLPAHVDGTHERTVKAIDLKSVAELLAGLSDVEGGPDFAFRPEWTPDGLGIQWRMTHGSSAVPRLGNPDASLLRWSYGAGKGQLFDLSIEEEAGMMGSEAWSIGGASDDKVLAARSYDATLLTAGYPLMQIADTGNSSITRQSTIQGRANLLTRLGRVPSSFWKVSVREAVAGSRDLALGDYWLGDLVTLTIAAERYYPMPGDYVRRIAKIEGKVGQQHYDLTFAEALA